MCYLDKVLLHKVLTQHRGRMSDLTEETSDELIKWLKWASAEMG